MRRLANSGGRDLQQVLKDVDARFFKGRLAGLVTEIRWSARPVVGRWAVWKLPDRVIEVNRLLDDPSVPDFVLDYMVFHEGLHATLPNESHRHHGRLFMAFENAFPRLAEVREWEKKRAREILLAPDRVSKAMDRYGAKYGLSSADIGAEFKTPKGKFARVVGWSRGMVVLEDVAGGEPFGGDPRFVAKLLGKEPPLQSNPLDERAQALVDLFGGLERKRVEKLTGVKLGELLGCGVNGCVFAASKGVVKVSYDDREALLAKALAGPRREPFLPVFYGGWTVEGPEVGAHKVFHFGVLHREDLSDWSPERQSSYVPAVKELVDAWVIDSEPRSLRLKLPPKDEEAIAAISGLRDWGEKNGVIFDAKEFAWEDDDDVQFGETPLVPNAISNLGVTADGRVVIRDLGGFEVKGKMRRAGDRKPLFDMVERLSSKRRNGPSDDWVYTVTWNGRLPSIVEHGLVPDAPEAIGRGGYRSHSQGRVFLTHGDGVSYWYERYQAHADNQSDDVLEDQMVPVVLRMKRDAVAGPFQDDPLGTRDAHAPAWFVGHGIDANDLEVWDGIEWVSVSDWESIDPTLAVRTEADPDDPERELHYWRNDEPLRPRFDVRRNIDASKFPGDPFDRIMKTLDALVAAGGKFEWIFGTNDLQFVPLIREILDNFGPFSGLEVRDRGRAIGIGTQDPRVLREFMRTLKSMHEHGAADAADLAVAIMAKLVP